MTTLISSLLNILDLSWIQEVCYSICLFIDGVIYTLVSYSYQLFMLMCQMNLSSITAIIGGLVDKVKAVVIVWIAFKIGVALIGYLISPDKAKGNSKTLVTNIFIVAALLVCYEGIFKFFDELNMLIVGTPDTYSFTILKEVAGVTDGADEGLIMRFMFGDSDLGDAEDVGDFLAYKSLGMFIRDKDKSSSNALQRAISEDDHFNFYKTKNVLSKIGKTVDYLPIVSTIVGLFIAYQIGNSAIAVGIRMFKIMILQLIAPIAIVCMIDGGFKNSTWKKFYQEYLSAFASAFVHIISMLMIVVFVGKFFNNIDQFFNNINGSVTGATKIILPLFVSVAGFYFGKELPGYIDKILGTHMAGKSTNYLDSVRKIVSAPIGAAVGFGVGTAAGIAAGNGLGSVLNGLATGYNAGVGGFKGNSVADSIKNINSANVNGGTRAANWAAAGGAGAYAMSQLRDATGRNPIVAAGRTGRSNEAGNNLELNAKYHDAQIKAAKDEAKALEAQKAAASKKQADTLSRLNAAASSRKTTGGTQINFGNDKSAYQRAAIENDMSVRKEKAAYEISREKLNAAIQNKASAQEIDRLKNEYLKAENTYKQTEVRVSQDAGREWEAAYENHSDGNTSYATDQAAINNANNELNSKNEQISTLEQAKTSDQERLTKNKEDLASGKTREVVKVDANGKIMP